MASINTTGSAGSSSRSAAQLTLGTPARVLFSLTLIAGLLALLINAVYAQDDAADSTSAVATPAATPAADMPRIELELEEVNESDMGGIVTLYEFGDSTIVEFDASGAGGDHPAFIIPGVCGDVEDDPVADLEFLDETGESVTTVDMSLEDLLDEDHVVEVRMSEDDDMVIACAFIEGEPLLDPAATPESTPEGTPEVTPTVTPDVTPAVTPDAPTPEVTEDVDDLEGVGGVTDDIDGTAGAAEADTLTVNLVDWSDTGVTGTAVLTSDGNVTQVAITIEGPGVVGGHEVHIHNGTCASPGTATYTLNPIDASGSSVSTISLSLEQLTRGNYFINVHPDEANWDAWMVCGNITGSPTTVSAPPPSTVVTDQIGDGTVGGNIVTVTTSAQAGEFPTTVGVGDALRWPSDTRTSIVWSIGVVAITMFASGLILRYGERSGKEARFTRLGL